MKNLELLTESEILSYLNGNDFLVDKINTIIDILKKHSTNSIKIIIDNFIENIPIEYENEIKTYSYSNKDNKKILKLKIYKIDSSLEWERGKYIHQVVLYSDDLKKHPNYEKKFPFYITTEGSSYNMVYYAQGVDEYIPSSYHFTNVEIAITQKANKDLRSLGLFDDFEIIYFI